MLAVELNGDTANAQVRSTAAGEVASTDTVTLVREGDDWKVSSLSDAGTAQP